MEEICVMVYFVLFGLSEFVSAPLTEHKSECLHTLHETVRMKRWNVMLSSVPNVKL